MEGCAIPERLPQITQTRWAIDHCLAYFGLTEEDVYCIMGYGGTLYLQQLWETLGPQLYEEPHYLLRQEWHHAYEAIPEEDPIVAGFFNTLPSDAVLLDFGCGTAEVCRPLWIATGRPMTLIEPSAVARGYLRAKYRQTAAHVGADIPPHWPSGCLDALVCTDVFEHVPEPLALLRQLWDLLAPGGQALFSFSQALPHPGHLPEAVAQFGAWAEWLNHHARIIDVDMYVWAIKLESPLPLSSPPRGEVPWAEGGLEDYDAR